MQNDMFKGKQKALHLIRELRIAEEPPIQHVRMAQEVLRENAFNTIQGEVIAKTLDFLSKEVLRVSEQRKISALVEHANKMRRVREAEESGRRQAEDVVRKKKDQQFRMEMQVHRNTSHRFLEDIFSAAIGVVSERKAEQKAKETVVPTTKVVPDSGLEEDEVEVLALVQEFLLPEVDRQLDDRTKIVQERRHATVAHKATNAMFAEVGRIAKNNWVKS